VGFIVIVFNDSYNSKCFHREAMLNSSAIMDLPFKVEIPKLSHSNLLQLLLPLIPGITLATGFLINHSPLVERMSALGLGYKTQLALAIGLAYICGFAAMQLTEVLTSKVHPLFRIHPNLTSGSKFPVSENPYWRRLAERYLGIDLMPAANPSIDDIDTFLRRVADAGGISPGSVQEVTKVRKQIANLQKALGEWNVAEKAALEKGSEIDPSALEKVSKANESLKNLESANSTFQSSIQRATTNHEWMALYNALSWSANVENPYTATDLLSLAFQTSALCGIWIMVHTHHWWGLSGTLFCIGVLFSASYTRWQFFRLSSFSRFYGTPELASLINKLAEQKKHVEHENDNGEG
jgi:hypothetical protein